MSLHERVREFVKDNFFVDSIADDESFLSSGIIDSLGIMQLVTFVQSEFDVTIPDTDLLPANFDSIARVAAYVERRRREAA